MEAWLQELRAVKALGIPSQACDRRISLPVALRGYPWSTIARASLAYPVPPLVVTVATWYRNINLLSIAYA